MAVEDDRTTVRLVKNQEQAFEVMDRLIAVARPSAAFGEPIRVGDQTVIPASEVMVGMGFGFGMGSGTMEAAPAGPAEAGGEGQAPPSGSGGGGGGGGYSTGRPVAVVRIGADGVSVEPVVDATKIALAFFTVLGSMAFMLARMRRGLRG